MPHYIALIHISVVSCISISGFVQTSQRAACGVSAFFSISINRLNRPTRVIRYGEIAWRFFRPDREG